MCGLRRAPSGRFEETCLKLPLAKNPKLHSFGFSASYSAHAARNYPQPRIPNSAVLNSWRSSQRSPALSQGPTRAIMCDLSGALGGGVEGMLLETTPSQESQTRRFWILGEVLSTSCLKLPMAQNPLDSWHLTHSQCLVRARGQVLEFCASFGFLLQFWIPDTVLDP